MDAGSHKVETKVASIIIVIIDTLALVSQKKKERKKRSKHKGKLAIFISKS